ncbi:MFS transporter [Streptomyces sp. cg40]|uniref:MFS transporter n=1 Tax=Streptomyces sp. cg40 TaxID=3419764 RepID=UPI003D00A687
MTQESPPHGPAHHPVQHHGEGNGPPAPRRWATLALLCMAQFLLIVDVTVINVALPTVGDSLGLGPGQLTWAVTAYTLCFGSLLLLGGRAGDAFGRKRMFLTGLVVFTSASLMSGLAEGGGTLIAARAAQGVGAALLSPAAMAIITSMFDGPERNRALGVWAAIGGSGAAFGVLLGGVLTTSLGWRWIFFVNVPIGAVVFGCVAFLLKEPAGHPHGHSAESRKGIDPAGALTMTAAPGLLIYGLVQARDHGFGSASVVLPLLGAVLCAGVFVAVERSVRVPLVRLSVLTRRNLVGGGLVMLAASGVLISTFFLCSLYLQHVLGLSALKTGLVFLPVAVAITLGAHFSSHLIALFGWRPVAVGGFALGAAGSLLLSRVEAGGSAWTQVLPGFLVGAVGLGAGFVCATTSAMSGVPHEDMGLTSGLVNTCHELGASLGVAVVATVAGTSLDGGSAAPPVNGFDSAFTACAVIALSAAVLGGILLPRGRPDPSQGPVFAH